MMLRNIKRSLVCVFTSWIWLGTVIVQEAGSTQYLDVAVDDPTTSGVEMYLCSDQEDTLLSLNMMKEVKKVVKIWKTPEITLREDYLPVLHYLQTTCLDNTTLLLSQISDMKLLDKKHKWLVEGRLEERELTTLAGLRMDSNFVWHKTDDDTIYDLYKVHPSQPLILTQLHSPNYTRPTRNDMMAFPVPACLIKFGDRLRNNESFEVMADKYLHPESSAKMVALLPLLRHLLDSFNFTYDIIYHKGWGSRLPNNTYTEALGTLHQGKCELSLTIFHVRIDRADVGEMLPLPVYSDMMIIFQEAKSFGTWNALLDPFTTQSWLFTFLILTVFFFTFYFSLKSEQHSENLSAIIEYLSASLSQQGVEYHGRKTSSRLLLLCLVLFTYFIYTYYNCQVLNSLLSTNPPKINNLRQLLDTDIRFGFIDFPYMRANLTNGKVSIIGPVDEETRVLVKRVFENEKRYYSMEEAHPLIRARRLALLANEGLLFHFLQTSFTESDVCSTVALLKYRSHNTIFLAKGSYLKEMATQKVLWMRETGLYSRRISMFEKMPTCLLKADTISVGIGMKGCTVALILLLAGFITTILIFPLELYSKNKKKTNS